jgi:hypothetical protein
MGAPSRWAGTRTNLRRPKPSKDWGLYTFAWPQSVTRPWRCSGWRSRRREEAKRGSRPAASKGALVDGGGVSRGTTKASPLPARACTTATAQQNHGGMASGHDGSRRKGDWGQRPNLHPAGASAEVHGHPVGVEVRARAHRGHGYGGSRDSDGDTAARTAIAQKKQRTGEQAGLRARRRLRRHLQEFFPAWLDGRYHQWRAQWRSGRHDVFPSARRPGHPQMSGEGRSSPWWPLAEVKASVKWRGAARRCGRGRRHCRGCRRRGVRGDSGSGSSSRAVLGFAAAVAVFP